MRPPLMTVGAAVVVAAEAVGHGGAQQQQEDRPREGGGGARELRGGLGVAEELRIIQRLQPLLAYSYTHAPRTPAH
eukprot:COSAG05_NODE_15734_length_362_cov_1.384030_1_plen_76_part_00